MPKTKKVLIVEKDKKFAELLARNCKAWGFKPEVIFSGADALNKKTGDYLFITTELSLAVVNGKTLLQTYAKLKNDTPVIVITDVENEDLKQELTK